MIGLRQINARIARLDDLGRGLAREAATQKGRLWSVLVSVEQREYVAALRKAAEDIGEARAALAKAAQKLAGYPLA